MQRDSATPGRGAGGAKKREGMGGDTQQIPGGGLTGFGPFTPGGNLNVSRWEGAAPTLMVAGAPLLVLPSSLVTMVTITGLARPGPEIPASASSLGETPTGSFTPRVGSQGVGSPAEGGRPSWDLTPAQRALCLPPSVPCPISTPSLDLTSFLPGHLGILGGTTVLTERKDKKQALTTCQAFLGTG